MVITLGQQYDVGEKPTVILYTYINRHAEPPKIMLYSSLYLLITVVFISCLFVASTAVGPYIVHRNRNRLLLSQSTLREEFVEKQEPGV